MAAKPAPAVVVMASPPLVKATVAPVLLERVTAGPAGGERVLLAPLKVTVPAVLLATLIPSRCWRWSSPG